LQKYVLLQDQAASTHPPTRMEATAMRWATSVCLQRPHSRACNAASVHQAAGIAPVTWAHYRDYSSHDSDTYKQQVLGNKVAMHPR